LLWQTDESYHFVINVLVTNEEFDEETMKSMHRLRAFIVKELHLSETFRVMPMQNTCFRLAFIKVKDLITKHEYSHSLHY